MNKIFYILMTFVTFGCQPTVQSISEVKKTKEVVKQATEYVNSDKAKLEQSRLRSEDKIELESKKSILAKNNEDLNSAMNVVIMRSDSIDREIENIIVELEREKSKSTGDETNNSRDKASVNEILLNQKKATSLKLLLINTISEYEKISVIFNIDEDNTGLPLKLGFEHRDKSWEEYVFRDMPTIAVIPVLGTYARDNKLAKLYLLEQLALVE